jgi:hypothetical protein
MPPRTCKAFTDVPRQIPAPGIAPGGVVVRSPQPMAAHGSACLSAVWCGPNMPTQYGWLVACAYVHENTSNPLLSKICGQAAYMKIHPKGVDLMM